MDNKPIRKAQRLKAFDYSSCGAYFITFNVADSKIRLSVIKGDVTEDTDNTSVHLTKYGRILDSVIKKCNGFYDGLTVSAYVIMPNHVHLIVELTDETQCVSTFVGTVKRLCTKEYGKSIWQKSFYDHIIKNDDDYFYHLQYIDENPKKWKMGKDEYYS